MSVLEPLATTDFQLLPRGPFLFDRWGAKRSIASYLGDFNIELREAPDEESLYWVNELVKFIVNQPEEVLDKIYDHYQMMAEQKHWMKGCGVPVGLSRKRILRYIKSRMLVVMPDPHRGLGAFIYINPQWDEEHKIDFQLRNGVLEFAQ